MFTVKQLATMASVTPRTLHYYDEIGLLEPASVGANGYRYYDEQDLLRLQQILFYRELGMPLEKIRAILENPGFDILSALASHRQELRKRIAQMERLLRTVDQTMLYLEGKKEMDNRQLFEGFSDEQQEEYEKEAMQIYDPETVKASNRRWKSYSAAEKQRIGEEGNAVYQEFLDAMAKGPASQEAQAAVEHWRRHMSYFWTPNEEQLLGLANGYNEDPRFKEKFDRIDPGLAAFIREAVRVYVKR